MGRLICLVFNWCWMESVNRPNRVRWAWNKYNFVAILFRGPWLNGTPKNLTLDLSAFSSRVWCFLSPAVSWRSNYRQQPWRMLLMIFFLAILILYWKLVWQTRAALRAAEKKRKLKYKKHMDGTPVTGFMEFYMSAYRVVAMSKFYNKWKKFYGLQLLFYFIIYFHMFYWNIVRFHWLAHVNFIQNRTDVRP